MARTSSKLNADQHAYFVGLAGDVTGDCLLAFHYCRIFRETLALTSEPDLTLVQVHDVDGMCTDWGGCRGHSDAFEVNVEDIRKTNRVGVKYYCVSERERRPASPVSPLG